MKIGVFDSGMGGLTVLAAIREALPTHDLVYLGDTARVPYGTRSPSTVIQYSMRVASYLVQQGVEAIVVACNTATTHALEPLREAGQRVGVPVFGVVEPGVDAALAVHRDGAIAVLGTEGTVRGGAYQRVLAKCAPKVAVQAIACPLFVPLAEEGWVEGPVPTLVAERYLADLRGRVDTVILGCTHYPILRGVIEQTLPDVHLVDSASASAAQLANAFGTSAIGSSTTRFVVTDHAERFRVVGRRFLGRDPHPVEWVDLGPPEAPFTA